MIQYLLWQSNEYDLEKNVSDLFGLKFNTHMPYYQNIDSIVIEPFKCFIFMFALYNVPRCDESRLKLDTVFWMDTVQWIHVNGNNSR